MKRIGLRFAALMAAMMVTTMMSAQQNDSLSTDTTMWFNQTHELSGVVVKGRLPKTRVKGDAMRTTVAGTILEKAGTINDALSSHLSDIRLLRLTSVVFHRGKVVDILLRI